MNFNGVHCVRYPIVHCYLRQVSSWLLFVTLSINIIVMVVVLSLELLARKLHDEQKTDLSTVVDDS